LILSINSCGKNAFKEKALDENITRTPGATVGDGECKPTLVSLSPVAAKFTVYNDLPLLFDPLEQGDYTSELEADPTTGLGGYKLVEKGQVELPFDFKTLDNVDSVIKKIYLTFDTTQIYKNDWDHHRSQLCHSFNKKCSGDIKSVIGYHINTDENYTWVDDNFSKYVETFPGQSIGTLGFLQRKFSANVDMKPYFSKDMNLKDLPANYFIVVSDDHLIKNSKLNIEYCAQ
jgi:hypothetical protein